MYYKSFKGLAFTYYIDIDVHDLIASHGSSIRISNCGDNSCPSPVPQTNTRERGKLGFHTDIALIYF